MAEPVVADTAGHESEVVPVQVDDDLDSTLGSSDTQSELATLRSSIYDYQYENGRRYHAYHAGSYWGPNDEQAMAHLDLAHHCYNMLFEGKLFLAPIGDDVQRVLDVGTGTGIWAIDFADSHPSANIIGTDLSPIQPQWVPPNLSFEVSDCCEPWTFNQKFDYIHVRVLSGSVADWPAFYAEVLKHLKPGGWIEQLEQSAVPGSFDDTVKGTIFEEWGRVSLQAGDAFGKSIRIVDEAADYMRNAGFEQVTEQKFAMPIGPWPKDKKLKDLGTFNRAHWEAGIEGWTIFLLTAYLKWTPEEVQLYLARMREGLRNPKIHAYMPVTVVYARKPLNKEDRTG